MDKIFDINARRLNDMIRLKQYLERLRCDFQMLTMNKKISKAQQLGDDSVTSDNNQEISTDSDRIIND